MSEISVEFVRAIEEHFPSLHTLKACRLTDTTAFVFDSRLWIEYIRLVLLAAIAVTSNHSTLKYARWCEICNPKDMIVLWSCWAITVNFSADNVGEVHDMLLAPFYTMKAEF